MRLPRKSLLLWVATGMFYVVFVAAYEHRAGTQIAAETQRYAELLNIHVWNFDSVASREYLEIIGRAKSYQALSIKHPDGSNFLALDFRSSFYAIDEFLHRIGLQPNLSMVVPMRYQGEHIGDLHAVWRNRNIYLHLNVLVLLVLIVSIARYLGKIAAHEIELKEREAVEQALRTSEAKWRTLVEHAPDIILTLDHELRVTYVNRLQNEIPTEMVLGRKITELFPSPNENQGIAAFNRVITTGEPTIYDADTPDPVTGELRYFSARMGPIVEAGEITGALLVVTEVTQQRQFAAELEAAKDDAETANRLKTDFLANMSHEIRTPLNVILGYTSLVEKYSRPHLPKERLPYFDYIRNAGRRLMDTIQKIVDISRFHIEDFPFIKEHVPVNDIVQQCIAELNILAQQKGIQLRYAAPTESYWVDFDRYALTQSLTNVVENAIKYTRQGSVDVTLEADDSTVIVHVRDSGVGIAEDYLPRIFDEFSQEKGGYSRPFEGTGLGMALVKKFQDLGNGNIQVKSEKGKGTAVTLSWPRVRHAPRPTDSRSPRSEQAPTSAGDTTNDGRRATALLIEDDPSTQSFMQTALEELCDIEIASNAEEAENILARMQPDIILMDLSLKDGDDGITLTKRLRQDTRFEQIPIIALTAHALDADRENALAAGCDDYLSKPCPLEKLLRTVEHHTQSRQSPS